MNEKQLFDYVKQNVYKDLVKSTGTYDSFDCTSEQSNAYIELKCRYKHYPELLIEKSKYDRLIIQANSKGMIPLYINSTPQGQWSFDLSKITEPAWSNRLMPATTEFTNTRKVIKAVGFLDITQGVEI